MQAPSCLRFETGEEKKRRVAAFKINQDTSMENSLGCFTVGRAEEGAGIPRRGTRPPRAGQHPLAELSPGVVRIFLNCKNLKSHFRIVFSSNPFLLPSYCLRKAVTQKIVLHLLI